MPPTAPSLANYGNPGLRLDRQRHRLHRPLRQRPRETRDHPASRTGPPARSPRRLPALTTRTTCGKVERFQQTLKKWLASPATSSRRSSTCNTSSTPSATTTTPIRPHRALHRRHPVTGLCQRVPKRPPAASRSATATTASATTKSTLTASSPCVTTAAYTTSASADTHAGTTSPRPRARPAHPHHHPPAANRYATSNSIPPATTSPNKKHPHQRTEGVHYVARHLCTMSRDIAQVGPEGVEPSLART